MAVMFIASMLIYRQISAQGKAAEERKAEALFSKMSQKQAPTQPDNKNGQSSALKPQKEIIVDIKGAVKMPGIYRMKPDDRVSDAINDAGGLTVKADENKINLAQKVSDEMVIYVPEKGTDKVPEIVQASGGGAVTPSRPGTSGQDQVVNINTADEQELQNLPGIGPAKAKAIFHYREEHGPFKTVDELTNVTGIGEKSLEKIKPSATVN
ncbi:competence protein ComEA [Sporolactobacillus sp. THM7-4]|nr:competence protein ComEA [Sporolactobacillus sp. THM7-4]